MTTYLRTLRHKVSRRFHHHRPGVLAFEAGPIGGLINTRLFAVAALVALGLILLAGAALSMGSYPLSFMEVGKAIMGVADERANFVVNTLRLPRVLVALMVGALLAMSGAIFQGIVRNPLVSPDVIGVNAGAAAAVVFWMVSGGPVALIPLVAFAGAVVAAAAVYLLSWKGHVAAGRLVLVGIGLNAMLTAATTFLLIRTDLDTAQRAVHWLAGSVYGAKWDDVYPLFAALALLLPVGTILMWHLRIVQMGDDAARSVGMGVERVRLALILVGCAASAMAVSIAGPVGFIALVVPHMARMIAGAMSGSVFLFTALLGALLMIAADTAGHHLLPVTLPVGVVTGAIGAPYFLYLLYRTNTRL
jgi:iron-siderophore transport system permease protein